MSLKGPCLCGDPYCPSCGSPGAQDEELAGDWLEELCESLREDAKNYNADKFPYIEDQLLELFGSDLVSDTFREAILTEATRYFKEKREKENVSTTQKGK